DPERSAIRGNAAPEFDAATNKAAVRDFCLGLYEGSETFRRIYNRALDVGRLIDGWRWEINIIEPSMIDSEGTTFDETFRIDQLGSKVYIPSLRSPILFRERYLSVGGELVQFTPEHVLT